MKDNPYKNLPIEDQKSILAVLEANRRYAPEHVVLALRESLDEVQRHAKQLVDMAAAKSGKHYYRSRFPEGDEDLYVYGGEDYEGDIRFRWEKVGGNDVVSVNAFDDSWRMLHALPDLIALMGGLNVDGERSSPTIEEFIAELEKAGFSEYRSNV